jgi:anti-sigma regulatory factor (Ser/Thr protein kinase)
MPENVMLPSRFTIESLYPFVRSIVRADGYPASDRFTFDFRYLTFINGQGLTVFMNTMDWLHHLGVPCYYVNHDTNLSDGLRYLDSCGFFERYLGAKINPFATVRSTTLPCTRVPIVDGHEWLEFRFEPWMAATLGVDGRALYSLRACVKEIFNNIRDHSTRDIGCIHLQHYPRLRTVNITVSDFGRGIPNTIREKFGPMADAIAILKATEEGVTAQTTRRNRGVGLNYLTETVVANGGAVTIYSFGGALLCTGDSAGKPQRHPWAGNGSYPGTLVDIMLKIDTFVGDELVRENLEW